ncbi:MAG: extracellular solute-binding protein, partial [Clostridia bacterium]|nr:extracellular solute-binding protein [Clostridia bacterium]
MRTVGIKRIAVLAVSLILLAELLVVLLSGCHSSRKVTGFTVPETFDENKKYEITFWAKNDSNIVQKRIYEAAIKNFQELYPNITVSMKSYTDYGAIFNDVNTNIATRTTPDVCITYPDHIATYLTGDDVVVPL